MQSCSSALRPTPLNSRFWSFSRIPVGQLPHLRLSATLICHLDIERMYGKRKAIAKRTPLFPSNSKQKFFAPIASQGSNSPSAVTSATATPRPERGSLELLSTPPVTEGETASETDLETETEFDVHTPPASKNKRKIAKHQVTPSNASSVSFGSATSDHLSSRSGPHGRGVSQHDLLNKYFRRDTVVFRNLDLLRCGHAESSSTL